MNCERCRISVSARLDGESEEAPAAEVDAHLERCADCRAFQTEAGEMTRNLRVRLVSPTPDLTGPVLARAGRPGRARQVLRAALAVTALAQIVLAVAQMVGMLGVQGHGAHGHGMAAHLFNESTAWNLALGFGMLWASWRDRTTAGVLPVLGAFVAVLTGFSVHDLIIGAATAERVSSHALLVVGLGLLVAIQRGHGHRRGGGPAPAGAGQDRWTSAEQNAEPELAAGAEQPHLRPTAHRRAA